MSTRSREALFLGAVLAALALVQSVHLTRPFLRHHESVATEISKHARNHLKFGLGKTYGLKLDVSGPSLEPYGDHRRYFYANHPPLPVLVMAAAFAVFGVSEAVFRVLLIGFSLAAVVLFRRIAARLLPPPGDRLATLLFAAMPAFAYYSIVTAYPVMTLTCILAAVLFYLRWCESGRTADYAGLLAFIALACSCAWPGYYVAPVLILAHFRSGRPGMKGVLALLGWNVALFGIYLLHLWIASPPDLDPIRKLLSAGADRASLQGMPIPRYVLGEARKVALLITIPATGLAAAWLISTRFRNLTPSDRLIAALALLGLDEIVFARLSSQHEYYIYYLIVCVALGAGAGLAKLHRHLGNVRPRLAAPAVAGLVGLMLAQSAWMLQRRLTTEGGYEFYYRLGLALRDRMAPRDRALILSDNLPFYTPYYGDVFTQYYDHAQQELLTEFSGGRTKGFSEQDLENLILAKPPAFDVVVTAEKATAVPKIRFLQGLDDAQLESFGVETRRTARRELLERRCGAPVECGGFLFWPLK